MEILIFIAIATILFGAGLIGLSATLTADRTALLAAVRAEVAKGTADAKAEYAKVVADATAAVTAVEKKI